MIEYWTIFKKTAKQ